MSKVNSSRRLRIPVRFINGVWECALGGPVPVKEYAEAELLVQRSSISDKTFLQMMELKERHRVLDEGTPLLICLTIKPEGPPPDDLRTHLKSYDQFRGVIATTFLDYWNPATVAFVEVNLASPDNKQARIFDTDRGGLWLITEGLEAVGLASTRIELPPGISKEPVASLNHAYTKLSEIFETWRISHTGNIYTRVLYQESSGTWYPLDVLRNKALDKQEQEIARGLWDALMAKMMNNASKKN